MSTAFIDVYPGMHRALASRIRVRQPEDIWAIGNTYTQMPPATAVKLQSLTADDLKGYRWDATGSRLRLRSLVAMGHSAARIARALGRDGGSVRAVLRDQETVSYCFRESCIKLWECWWDKTPPVNNGAQRAAMTKARQMAERKGWCCPAALDEDELDYPGYMCLARWLPATGSGIATDYPLG